MRLLLVGAFPYPYHQGSQVYFQEQAIALRRAGAEVELLTYASGSDPARGPIRDWRAVDGFERHRSPRWTTPGALHSGPSWSKPLADLGLRMTLNDAFASKMTKNSPYDAILAHNVEAGLIAMTHPLARHGRRIPVVYCVHTLMANELSAYFNYLKIKGFPNEPRRLSRLLDRGRRSLRRIIDRGGAAVDRGLARRADGWISLTRSSSRVMRRSSNRPGAQIPPPVPDPHACLDPLDPGGHATRHGLELDGFYLYSGNLDGYQELELLARASGERCHAGRPIVVASHDPAVLDAAGIRRAGIEVRRVESETEMLSLLAAARASLITRRAEGGFPIKLANSLAVGTPPITFLEREWGLSDGENALVAQGGEPARSLADAILALDRSPELAARLGSGARALYEANHRPRAAAQRTLELVETVCRAS